MQHRRFRAFDKMWGAGVEVKDHAVIWHILCANGAEGAEGAQHRLHVTICSDLQTSAVGIANIGGACAS